MAWIAGNGADFRSELDDRLGRRYDAVVARAWRLAGESVSRSWRTGAQHAVYFGSLQAGAVCGLAALLAVGLWGLTTWIRVSARW